MTIVLLTLLQFVSYIDFTGLYDYNDINKQYLNVLGNNMSHPHYTDINTNISYILLFATVLIVKIMFPLLII